MRQLIRFAAAISALAVCAPAAAGTILYTYDEQGRLATASYSDGTTIVYAYDLAGNRITAVVNNGGCINNWNSAGSFTWGASLWCKALSSPLASNVTATVVENSSGNPITLRISNGTPASVAVSTQANHGAASASGIAITYTPSASYAGPDSFQYTATNGFGTAVPATASITVQPLTHVSPNPVWSNIFGQVQSGNLTECNSSQPIQGIGVPITLQLNFTAGSSGTFQYSLNNGSPTTWANGGTVSVTNNNTLSFCVKQTGIGQALGNITVTNQSDSNTVIGTFSYSVTVGSPP